MTFRDLLPWYIISHFNCGFLWIQKKPASICQHNFPFRKKKVETRKFTVINDCKLTCSQFFLFLQFCEVFLRILSNANITNFFKVDNGWHEGIVYDCLWTAIHIFYFLSHIFYAINNWRPQFEINDNFSTNLEKMSSLPNPFM